MNSTSRSSSCSYFSCICAGEDASIVQARGEKVVGLAGHFWLQQFALLIPGNVVKCGVLAQCPQVIVKITTFLKPNVSVA